MQHRTTLRYTEQLVAQAVGLYWRRTIDVRLLVVDAAMVAFLAWRLLEGDRSWIVGVVAAAVLLGLAMPIAVYVAQYRNSMGKLREMSRPLAELVVDDDAITLTADNGSGSMKWGLVKEVWRFESVWLLLLSKAQFITLPVADVPESMRAFILDRVLESGGRIK